jgi:hypothetical protein
MQRWIHAKVGLADEKAHCIVDIISVRPVEPFNTTTKRPFRVTRTPYGAASARPSPQLMPFDNHHSGCARMMPFVAESMQISCRSLLTSYVHSRQRDGLCTCHDQGALDRCLLQRGRDAPRNNMTNAALDACLSWIGRRESTLHSRHNFSKAF